MRPLVALAALALAGCAYYRGYNGIYAADRMADEARKATAEGRPGEATNLWSRAAVKAESLLVRQPGGKWSLDALAIRGEALAALGQCVDALPVLREAQARAGQGELAERVALALGRCEMLEGSPDAAVDALASLSGSRDEWRRTEAATLRARALLGAGRYEEALGALDEVGFPPTSFEVLAARAGLGQREALLAAADQLLALRDSTIRWDSLLAVVGQANPELGSALLDRLAAGGGVPAGALPYLLSADAGRRSGEARRARLAEVVRVAPNTDVAEVAQLDLARETVASTREVSALAPLADSLEVLAARQLPGSVQAATVARVARRVVAVADSVSPGMPQGDLRLFLAAEYARDSLGAPGVALTLFERVAREWPEGDYAPKALLAGRQLDAAWAEVTDSLLAGRYAASPYVIAARGGPRDGYLRLEDSLAAYARAIAPTPAPTAPRRPAARPGPTRRAPGDSAGGPPRPQRRVQSAPEP